MSWRECRELLQTKRCKLDDELCPYLTSHISRLKCTKKSELGFEVSKNDIWL